MKVEINEIRLRFDLSKRESEAIKDAMWHELKNPDKQKWFMGSNNRLHRVITGLQTTRKNRRLQPLEHDKLLSEANTMLRTLADRLTKN